MDTVVMAQPPQTATKVPPGPQIATRADVKAGLGVIAALAACGAPLALLWWWFAPRMPLVAEEIGVMPTEPQPNEYVGSDLTFFVIASIFAVVAAVVVWRVRRFRGPVLVLALALGVLAANWVMWQLGEELGSSEVRRLIEHAAIGDHLEVPVVRLRLTGMLFGPVVLAVAGYLIAAAAHHEPNLAAGESSDKYQRSAAAPRYGDPSTTLHEGE